MVLHSHDRMREGRVLQREENKEKGRKLREGGREGESDRGQNLTLPIALATMIMMID